MPRMKWELSYNGHKETWAIRATYAKDPGFFKLGYKDPRKLVKEFLIWDND